jgi:1-phosphatidylinositol-3-phosphate 5-kinase
VNSQIANHDLNDLIDATLYSQGRVYHDNNFIYKMGARPMPMRYTMHKILNVCVNNDTLCLAKSQIIDYSLLVIINKKTKKLRFGIIDYVQHYNLEKKFET